MHMCSTGTLTVLAALSLTACGRAPDPGPGVLIVSAASSLTTVIEPLVQAFERDTGIAVELNLAASSTLASQVLAGAPVDVFISADHIQMDRVAAAGLLRPATRTVLLSNQLVVVAPLEPPVLPATSPDVLASFERIAIADPVAVPAALVTVESGAVDAGLVYRTDALSSNKVTQVYAVPVADGPEIVYPVAVTAASADPAASERLLAYLSGAGASASFESAGFIMPKARR